MATIETLIDANGYPFNRVTGTSDQPLRDFRIKCNTCGQLPEAHQQDGMRCDLSRIPIRSEMVTVFNY